MNIRTTLTLKFLFIVFLLFFITSVAIYITSANYRRESYYERLLKRASSVATILIDVDEIDATLLKRIEKNNPGSLPNEKVAVYDYKNELIFSTDEEGIFQTDSNLLNRIRLQGEIRYKQGDYEMAGFLFTSRYDRFVVISGAMDIYGFKRLQNLKTVLLTVNSINILLVFATGWFFSGQALSPIKSVMNQVNKISINKLDLRVDEGNGTDEIAQLAKTFNDMLVRLEQAFKMQKNFIANASHELRTPLSVLTAQTEVCLMQDRPEEEYRSNLRSILEEMRNLNSISNRLLLLAQTSTGTGESIFTPVRIDEILWQVQSELKKRNSEYQIDISLGDDLLDYHMLTTSGNEQLLKTAFLNLADNGCKYSPDHRVLIQLQTGGSQKIVIRFIDHGIGILPEDITNIFEPFHRGKNAISFKGHGIGLSLVDRIIRSHQGTVSVRSVQRETIFTVHLPVTGTERT